MNQDVELAWEQNEVTASGENETRDFFSQATGAYNVDDFARALAAVPDAPVAIGDEI